MPSLNLDLNFEDHPKTRRLIGILGDDADALPVRLWLYCGRIHPKDGRMKGYSIGEVEAAMRWRGEPGVAVAAMLKVAYIKKTASGYECVDWLQHEGHLKAFSERGRKAATARWSKLSKKDCSATTLGMHEALHKDKTSNAPTDRAVPTKPSKPTKPTEPAAAQQPVDVQGQFKKAITDLALSKLTPGEQQRLLDLRMPFGEREGARIYDLDPTYCAWVLTECEKPAWKKPLGDELKNALSLRVRVKAEEVAR
jgi:uncharacterized protein (DUF3820 family)